MEFKDFLSAKRKDRKITIRDFAKQVKLSPSFVCDLESGNRNYPITDDVNPNLRDDLIKALKLNKHETEELDRLIDESLLHSRKVLPDMSSYLLKTPMAQFALRTAKENNITDEQWKQVINSFKNK